MRAFVLYVTITYLATYTANVYGIDPAAGIAEAIVTNAAVPGFFPPLIHANENYVDCGVYRTSLCNPRCYSAEELPASTPGFRPFIS